MQIENILGEPILPPSYYVVIMYLHMSVQDCMGKATEESGKNRQTSVKLWKWNFRWILEWYSSLIIQVNHYYHLNPFHADLPGRKVNVICTLCHFLKLFWPRYLYYLVSNDKDIPVLHSLCRPCWWLGRTSVGCFNILDKSYIKKLHRTVYPK